MSCNILALVFGVVVRVIGGDAAFVVIEVVNVVGWTGFVGNAVGVGFVCPKDSFPIVVLDCDVVDEDCSGGDILNALLVKPELLTPPKAVSNPPKAAVKSPNAPPPPPPLAPPTLPVPETTVAAAGAEGTDCGFGA